MSAKQVSTILGDTYNSTQEKHHDELLDLSQYPEVAMMAIEGLGIFTQRPNDMDIRAALHPMDTKSTKYFDEVATYKVNNQIQTANAVDYRLETDQVVKDQLRKITATDANRQVELIADFEEDAQIPTTPLKEAIAKTLNEDTSLTLEPGKVDLAQHAEIARLALTRTGLLTNAYILDRNPNAQQAIAEIVMAVNPDNIRQLAVDEIRNRSRILERYKRISRFNPEESEIFDQIVQRDIDRQVQSLAEFEKASGLVPYPLQAEIDHDKTLWN